MGGPCVGQKFVFLAATSASAARGLGGIKHARALRAMPHKAKTRMKLGAPLGKANAAHALASRRAATAGNNRMAPNKSRADAATRRRRVHLALAIGCSALLVIAIVLIAVPRVAMVPAAANVSGCGAVANSFVSTVGLALYVPGMAAASIGDNTFDFASTLRANVAAAGGLQLASVAVIFIQTNSSNFIFNVTVSPNDPCNNSPRTRQRALGAAAARELQGGSVFSFVTLASTCTDAAGTCGAALAVTLNTSIFSSPLAADQALATSYTILSARVVGSLVLGSQGAARGQPPVVLSVTQAASEAVCSPLASASNTDTPTFYRTPSRSASVSTSTRSTVAQTLSTSVSPSASPSASAAATWSVSASASPSCAVSGSTSPTPSVTPTSGLSVTPSPSRTASASVSFSALPSVSPSLSPSNAASVSVTPSVTRTSAPVCLNTALLSYAGVGLTPEAFAILQVEPAGGAASSCCDACISGSCAAFFFVSGNCTSSINCCYFVSASALSSLSFVADATAEFVGLVVPPSFTASRTLSASASASR